MAIYQFVSSDGDVVERVYPMRDAPDLGVEITANGKSFRRVLSLPSNGTRYDSSKFPKISFAAPRYSGKNHVPSGRHKGRVVFNNQHEEAEYCRQNDFTRDYDTSWVDEIGRRESEQQRRELAAVGLDRLPRMEFVP